MADSVPVQMDRDSKPRATGFSPMAMVLLSPSDTLVILTLGLRMPAGAALSFGKSPLRAFRPKRATPLNGLVSDHSSFPVTAA
jgi:hypothetical protein